MKSDSESTCDWWSDKLLLHASEAFRRVSDDLTNSAWSKSDTIRESVAV